MAKIQKSTEVCDEWSQHALCPAGDTCGKLHGEETRSYVCDAYLYKGKCLYGRGRQTCRYSHPPQPSVTGTEYLRHLNLLQGRQIPLEQEIDDVSAISLETHRDVASYSWVKGTTDQIAIPGLPKKISRPTWPQEIGSDKQDKTKYLASQVHPQNGTVATFDPLLCSVLTLDVHWNASSYDFVSQHINLKRLLEVARGVELKNFRLDIEMHGKTLWVSQWLDPTDSTQTAVIGRGALFTEMVTSPSTGFEDFDRHHHIVEYTYAGLKMAVEAPIDAFGDNNTACSDRLTASAEPSDDEDPNDRCSSLQVVRKGRTLTTRDLIQTRAQDIRNRDEDYFYADLFVTRQTRVYHARYRLPGVIEAGNVHERDCSTEVANWVASRPLGMKKYAALLAMIKSESIAMATRTGHRSLSLVFQARNKELKLYPRTDGKLLVSDEMAQCLR